MEKYFDVNGKQITEGKNVKDLESGYVTEVFIDEDDNELAINIDGTTIYLSEVETEEYLQIIE